MVRLALSLAVMSTIALLIVYMGGRGAEKQVVSSSGDRFGRLAELVRVGTGGMLASEDWIVRVERDEDSARPPQVVWHFKRNPPAYARWLSRDTLIVVTVPGPGHQPRLAPIASLRGDVTVIEKDSTFSATDFWRVPAFTRAAKTAATK